MRNCLSKMIIRWMEWFRNDREEEMMLKKFLSTIGIGTMKVDTIVDKPEIAHGESLSGKIYI
ncbi:sporulation protein, partial [Leptospira santarosai]|nr:sporulation protein [Leptospira santarosai]